MQFEKAQLVSIFLMYHHTLSKVRLSKQEFQWLHMDMLLFYLPLAGSAFKKVYFDTAQSRAMSKFIAPEDLVVPYEASDLSSAERVIWLHGLPSCAPGTSAFSDIKPGLGCLCIYASRCVITGLTHKK